MHRSAWPAPGCLPAGDRRQVSGTRLEAEPRAGTGVTTRSGGGKGRGARGGGRGEGDHDHQTNRRAAHRPISKANDAHPSLAPTPAVLQRLYVDEGLPLKEVGERLGYSSSWVRTLLARNAIPIRRPGGRGLRDKGIDVEAVRRLYERDGWTIAEIAEELGTTRDKIAVRLHLSGAALRPAQPRSGRLPRLGRSQLVAAYVKRGMSIEQIAREHSCSPAHVRNELRRHDVHRSRVPSALPDGWAALTPALLRRLYVRDCLTAGEVAAQVGGSPARVLSALRRAGISRRPPGTRSGHRLQPLTAELLHQLYVVEGLSAIAIATRVGGVPDRVYPALARFGIPRRSPRRQPRPLTITKNELEEAYVAQRQSKEEIAAAHGASVWQVTQRIRADGIRRAPRARAKPATPPAAELARLYLDEGVTLADLTHRYRTSRPVVRAWLDDAGVPVRERTRREHRQRLPESEVAEAYWEQGCSAAEIAAHMGTAIHQVLRCMHDNGVAVRAGFGRDLALTVLDQLYADPDVARVLRRESIPERRQTGAITDRFPQPFALSAPLLRSLYEEIGLSARHIELLTGETHEQVLDALRRVDVEVRPPSSYSPWRQRQLDSLASPADCPRRGE